MPAIQYGAPCIFGVQETILHELAKLAGVPLPLQEGELISRFSITLASDAFAGAKLETVNTLSGEEKLREWVLLGEGKGAMEIEPWPAQYVSPKLMPGEKTHFARVRLQPGETITWSRDREGNVIGYLVTRE